MVSWNTSVPAIRFTKFHSQIMVRILGIEWHSHKENPCGFYMIKGCKRYFYLVSALLDGQNSVRWYPAHAVDMERVEARASGAEF